MSCWLHGSSSSYHKRSSIVRAPTPRCLYRHAEDDSLITEADNPARKVDKLRRLPSTRRAVETTVPQCGTVPLPDGCGRMML